jgi:hypothetical protein
VNGPLPIERTPAIPHPPGRRVLAVGKTRGQSPLVQTRARFGDLAATGRRPETSSEEEERDD